MKGKSIKDTGVRLVYSRQNSGKISISPKSSEYFFRHKPGIFPDHKCFISKWNFNKISTVGLALIIKP